MAGILKERLAKTVQNILKIGLNASRSIIATTFKLMTKINMHAKEEHYNSLI